MKRMLMAGMLLCPLMLAAQDETRNCSNATLKGDYGLVARGTQSTPAGLEKVITIANVVYDGKGGFTFSGVTNFSISGVARAAGSGTYHVNPDCTGGETTVIPIPGVPPIVDEFVIVDQGKEIRTNVVAPAGMQSSANIRKK